MSILPSEAKAGAILPLGKPDWLIWWCDKDETLGWVYDLCHLI